MVFFSRSSLERAPTQYVAHYHEERNHQELQNRLLKSSDGPTRHKVTLSNQVILSWGKLSHVDR
jgi:hypothetical protein